MGGIRGDHLADDKPVEQHPDRGEVLLDARLFETAAHRFDVGRDMHRLDVDQLREAARVALGEDAPAGAVVGFAGVRIFDGDREEL